MSSPVQNGHPSPPLNSEPKVEPLTSVKPQAATAQAAPLSQDAPLTSTQDAGDSKRPRDARLIHLVLSSLGVQSYQERVPLQLLDFAYRYTSGVLSDSLRLSAEGYAATTEQRGVGRPKGGATTDAGGEGITVTSVRQAIASRQGHTFAGHLPKEFMLEQAAERNRLALPKFERSYGVQLPPEKYCLTGASWNLKDEWESEEEVVDEPVNGTAVVRPVSASKEDQVMSGMEGEADVLLDDDEEEDEGGGRMEDVFGEEDAKVAPD